MAVRKSTTVDSRARSWTFVLYPESAPKDWRGVLDDEHIQWVESPLHDKDVNPDGTPKKPHWHILLMFEGKKSYEQIKEITDKLNATIPQKTASARGLVRYMVHMDNPEKFQYNVSDIIGHGGADVAELLKPSSTERYAMIREMIAFVREHGIMEFQDLMDYAATNRFDDWFPILCDSSSYVMSCYIKSCRNRQQKPLDYSTGEVVKPDE
jgi:hypothetical protein